MYIGYVNFPAKSGKSESYDFFITPFHGMPISGRQACTENILTNEELIQQNNNVVSNLNLVEEPNPKTSVTPKIHPPRRVPLYTIADVIYKATKIHRLGKQSCDS